MNKITDSYEKEMKIAKYIYQLDTKIKDIGFGLELYIVDSEVIKDSAKHLYSAKHVYGSWNKNGVIKGYYLKVCPAWSRNIEAAFELLEICLEPVIPNLPRYDFIDIVLLRQVLNEHFIFGLSPKKTANLIVDCILLAIKSEFTNPVGDGMDSLRYATSAISQDKKEKNE